MRKNRHPQHPWSGPTSIEWKRYLSILCYFSALKNIFVPVFSTSLQYCSHKIPTELKTVGGGISSFPFTWSFFAVEFLCSVHYFFYRIWQVIADWKYDTEIIGIWVLSLFSGQRLLRSLVRPRIPRTGEKNVHMHLQEQRVWLKSHAVLLHLQENMFSVADRS